MKNIALLPMSNRSTSRVSTSFVDRWGGLPLLCWLSVVGMPLQRTLEESYPVWVADEFAASLTATSNATALQSVPFALFMTSLYVCAGLMVLAKPKTAFSNVMRQWPALLLLLFLAVSILWSGSKGKALINLTNNLGVILITLAAALQYRTAPWLMPKHIAYVLGFNIVVHLISVFLIPAFSIDWEGRWRGLTGQANELGGIAFCAFWANATVLIYLKNDRYHLHVILAVCAAAVMLGANSMTSIMSSLSVLTMVYVITWKHSPSRRKRLFIRGLGVTVLLAAMGMVLLGSAMDINKLLGLAGRSSNFTGRTEIWSLAFNAIASSPLVGWGFDGNNDLIKSTGMPYTTYHNGFLDLLVCGGAIGLVIFFLLVGNLLVNMIKRTRVGSDMIPFSLPFLVAMLIYNMMEATLVTPRNEIWIIFLAIIFLGGCTKKSQLPIAGSQKWQMHIAPLKDVQSSSYSH